jgi:hypothetical protein
MIPLATHQIITAKETTDAMAAGQARMEELRTEGFNSLDLTVGTHSDTSGRYSRAWSVADDVPVVGSKRVDMSVSWMSSDGVQTARMTTFITR